MLVTCFAENQCKRQISLRLPSGFFWKAKTEPNGSERLELRGMNNSENTETQSSESNTESGLENEHTRFADRRKHHVCFNGAR
jgi:hypothetical protein